MADFKVGDRVEAKRNGYGIQVLQDDLGTVVGTTSNAVYIEMDNARGRSRELGSAAHYALDFEHARDLFKVVVVTPAEETMVPMSRVREVATRYAQANGWCGEVDRALAEIETPEDEELVEVTYTATRKVTLRRKHLEFLRDKDDMSRLFSGVAGQVFYGETVPQGAKLEDNVWSISEPRNISDEGWISFGGHNRPGGNPGIGGRVRVRTDRDATSMMGRTIRSGRIGRVRHSDLLRDGEVAVDFGEGDTSRIMRAEDMQAHPR